MKKALLFVAGALFVASGCSSTVTLGPQANEEAVIGATLSTSEAGVTLPFVKATAKTVKTTPKK